jgi:hypothetical protein
MRLKASNTVKAEEVKFSDLRLGLFTKQRDRVALKQITGF